MAIGATIGLILAMVSMPGTGQQARAVESSPSISGVVSLPDGAPAEWLAAVQVSASSMSGSSNGYASVDPLTGAYSIADLEPGAYRVQFSANSYWDGSASVPVNLVREYFNDTTDYSSATPVDVSTSSATNVDAELAMGRTISGKVSIPEGVDPESLRAVSVSAWGTAGSGYASVDPASGSYVMTGLVPGAYQVMFSVSTYWDGMEDVSANLVSEYYDDAADWSTATLVDVSSADQSGIDAALEPGRSISGTVSLPDGAPQEWLGSVTVSASSPTGGAYRYANVDPDTGDYTITGLAGSAYTVAFRTAMGMPAGETPNLADEYYDNAFTSAAAEPVDVSTGDRDSIDATLEYGTSISGTVTLPADAPTEWRRGISVSAVATDGSYLGNNAVVDPETGDYTLPRLAPGDYHVRFSAGSYQDGSQWVSTDLVSEYYDDAATIDTARLISTTDGDATSIDAELQHGASFSASVDASELEPTEGLGFVLTDLTGTTVYHDFGDGLPDNGRYDLALTNLNPGAYRLAVAATTWDESTGRLTMTGHQFLRFGSEASITLAAGEAVDDLQLKARAADASLAGSIHTEGFTGSVAGSILGSALLYERLDGHWVRTPHARVDADVDGDTAYDLAVPAGTYTVGFEDDFSEVGARTDITEQWWNSQATLDTADSITLNPGQRQAEVNGTLHATRAPDEGPRSISGVVSLPDGAPAEWLAAVQVSASSMSGSSFKSAPVDPVTGAYTIPDVEPGSYRVQFSVNQYWDGAKYDRPNLVTEYFDDTTDYSSATPVDVSMTSAANIDAELALGRSISGKISIPEGADPQGLRAVSVSASGSAGWSNASVDPATGGYTVTGLAPGAYQVQFSVSTYWDGTSSVSPNLVSEYYDNAMDWSAATPVDVSSADQSGIDAALEPGRSISGTVSLPDGAPQEWLGSVTVSASTPTFGAYRYANVDPDTGDYTITGLAEGAYTVAFRTAMGMPAGDTPDLADEYYDNAITPAAAEPVDVSTGDRDNIDATLEYGTSISGTVTLPADAPTEWRQGLSVSVFSPDGSGPGYYAAVDPDTGHYTIPRLAAGDHLVYFSAGGDLSPEYYDNAPTRDTATSVSTRNGDATGIDAELEHGASFSGTVDVSALGLSEGSGVGIGITITDLTGTIVYGGYGDGYFGGGHYDVVSGTVRPGSYRVAVSITEWDEATSQTTPISTQFLRFGSESSIHLNTGDAITGLALKARPADASLSGSMVAEGFADTTAGSILGSALAYERLDGQWVRLPEARFDTTGNGDIPYRIELPAGTYTVGFETDYATTDTGKIVEEWWKTKATLDTADSITLTSGQHPTHIDGRIGPAKVSPPSSATGSVPVYRFWSPVYQGHFYTTSASERDHIIRTWPGIWNYEGERYRAFATQKPGTIPLYRFWSERLKGHFYTASAAERDHVKRTWPDTWSYEGVAYYVYPADSTVPDTTTVARFWSPTAQHHFYTASAAERDHVIRTWPGVWSYEGSRFRVPAAGIPVK